MARYGCLSWVWSLTKFLPRNFAGCNVVFYPVHGANCSLMQPMWSAYIHMHWVFLIWYPYALVSLYGNTAHCSGYGVAVGCYGLSIVPRTPDNALTMRMHVDYRLLIDRFFVGFNAICNTFLRNNTIYIEGHNCSLCTVPVLFNKWSGLRPLVTLSTLWDGRHAMPAGVFVKSFDFLFESATVGV